VLRVYSTAPIAGQQNRTTGLTVVISGGRELQVKPGEVVSASPAKMVLALDHRQLIGSAFIVNPPKKPLAEFAAWVDDASASP